MKDIVNIYLHSYNKFVILYVVLLTSDSELLH